MSFRFRKNLNIDDFATVNRRSVLRGLGAAALLTATGGLFSRSVWGNPVFSAYPFSLGVASGDPAPDGFVIWTKIAPKPLEHGSGMPKKPVEVEWAVASDERMQKTVQKGKAIGHPELGHAVHVEVAGLEPARDYCFDDHEVDNNWAGDVSEENTPRELFLLRRAAAFQAWYEHMPLRRAQMPSGPDILAYRRLMIGDLMAMNVLDTRQYRSDQPCGDGTKANCTEALEPHRTMLGDTQERWLYDTFRAPAPRWTLLAQQVPIMHADRNPDPNIVALSMDKWDGAVAARDRLFAAVENSKLRNLIVADGDVHLNCAGELKKDFADEKSPVLGVEFVATSITSLGDGYDTNNRHKALMQQDPHIKFYNAQRGYMRHGVTPERWQADFQVLDKVTVPDGRMSTRKSFVVENGISRLVDA